jgi:hypothetical protein
MQQKVGEFGRQTVARRVAGKICDERAQTAARGRLCRLASNGAGNLVGSLGLADHPLDCAETLVALAPDLPGQLRQQSEHAEALELGGEHHPAPRAFRINLGRGDEASERAVDEVPGL